MKENNLIEGKDIQEGLDLTKHLKEGMEVYSAIYGKMMRVHTISNKIILATPLWILHIYNLNGSFIEGGECMLFPSKEKRTWAEEEAGEVKALPEVLELDGIINTLVCENGSNSEYGKIQRAFWEAIDAINKKLASHHQSAIAM